MNSFETAMELAKLGYSTHALCRTKEHRHGTGKERKMCLSRGKVPMLKGWPKHPEDAEARLLRANSVKAEGNVGILCGDGLVVIDADRHNEGIDGVVNLQALFEKNSSELPAPTVLTGGGGSHYYFRVPDGLDIDPRNSAEKLAPGVDVRANGGQVVAPPSKHKNGNRYEWVDGLPPHVEQLPVAPMWLLDIFRAPKRTAAPMHRRLDSDDADKSEVERALDFISPDVGYQDWVNVGMALHQGGYPMAVWDEWSKGSHKYAAEECKDKWDSFDADRGTTMLTLWWMAREGGYTKYDSDVVRDAQASTYDKGVVEANKAALEKQKRIMAEEAALEEQERAHELAIQNEQLQHELEKRDAEEFIAELDVLVCREASCTAEAAWCDPKTQGFTCDAHVPQWAFDEAVQYAELAELPEPEPMMLESPRCSCGDQCQWWGTEPCADCGQGPTGWFGDGTSTKHLCHRCYTARDANSPRHPMTFSEFIAGAEPVTEEWLAEMEAAGWKREQLT